MSLLGLPALDFLLKGGCRSGRFQQCGVDGQAGLGCDFHKGIRLCVGIWRRRLWRQPWRWRGLLRKIARCGFICIERARLWRNGGGGLGLVRLVRVVQPGLRALLIGRREGRLRWRATCLADCLDAHGLDTGTESFAQILQPTLGGALGHGRRGGRRTWLCGGWRYRRCRGCGRCGARTGLWRWRGGLTGRYGFNEMVGGVKDVVAPPAPHPSFRRTQLLRQDLEFGRAGGALGDGLHADRIKPSSAQGDERKQSALLCPSCVPQCLLSPTGQRWARPTVPNL